MIVSSNGNLGGITGYNAPTGAMERCASGNWLLVNKSAGIGVGTGGIIGMNETEKELRYLFNQSFVGRQLVSDRSDRFAGGIIGTQSNKTTENWTSTATTPTIRVALSASGRATAARLKAAATTACSRRRSRAAGSARPAASSRSSITPLPIRISTFSPVRTTAVSISAAAPTATVRTTAPVFSATSPRTTARTAPTRRHSPSTLRTVSTVRASRSTLRPWRPVSSASFRPITRM